MGAKHAPINPRRFYASVLNEAERADIAIALEVNGLDEEIALLRLKLRAVLQKHPEDLPLMFRGIELLVKLVAARYRLSTKDKAEFEAALVAGLRDEINHSLLPVGRDD